MQHGTEKRRLVVGRIVKGEITEYKTAVNQDSREAVEGKPADGMRQFDDDNTDEKWITDWRGNRTGRKKPWWKFW